MSTSPARPARLIQSGKIAWCNLHCSANAASHIAAAIATTLDADDRPSDRLITYDTLASLCDHFDSRVSMLLLNTDTLAAAADAQVMLARAIERHTADASFPVILLDERPKQPHTPPQEMFPLLRHVANVILLPPSAIEACLPGLIRLADAAHAAHATPLRDEPEFSPTSPPAGVDAPARPERLFQSLLEVLPVGVLVAHDRQCLHMTMNPAAAQLLDMPRHLNPSMTGPHRHRHTHRYFRQGKEVPPDQLPMQRAARDGTSTFGVELDITRGDGTKLVVAFYAVPLLNDQGQPSGSIGVMADITHQKKTEQAISESEATLKLAQKCAKAGSWDWNIITGQIIWSEEQYRLHNLPTDRQITFDTWAAQVHPDDRQTLLDAIRSHREFQVEYRLATPLRHHPDTAMHGGKPVWKWALASGHIILNKQNTPMRVLGICMDITDPKIAEQTVRDNAARFRSMVDASPLGVFITDSQGRYEYVNHQLQRITGRDQQQLLEHGLEPMIHPDEKNQVIATWNEALAGSKRFESIFRIIVNPMHTVWLHMRAEPTTSENQLKGYVGKVEDITQQRMAQAALRQSEEHLKRANASLAQRNDDMEEFLSITAHDLKHPVVGIQGLLTLLREDCYDKLSLDNQQNLDLSLGECDRMKEMLTRLSELGRIEQTRPQMSQASLRDVVELCTSRYKSISAKRNIRIDMHQVCDVTLLLPKAILEEVLSNLIDNAIKYGCGDQGGHVIIEARCHDNHCVLRVTDHGRGIDPKHHDRVFKPFRRLVHPSQSQNGSGLGLTAVKRLIQRVGGQVRLVSELNRGATFELTFPLDMRPHPPFDPFIHTR